MLYPFNAVEYYGQFSKGYTILRLVFVKKVEPLPTAPRSIGPVSSGGHLEYRELLGVYEGIAESSVIIGKEKIQVPVDAIREFLEVDVGKLFEIASDFLNSLDNAITSKKGRESSCSAASLINALRHLNETHSILVPKYKLE